MKADAIGLSAIALTDHNTCKNCPAFFKAAKKHGIIPIAGMELTSAEDIHIVCLFEYLEDAMRFDEFVQSKRTRIKNKAEIFGEQLILDENDDIIDKEEFLLINATDISIDDITEIVLQYNGICYPAHIDREANGIIAILGSLPIDTPFSLYELHDAENIDLYSKRYGIPKNRFIISSDAHYLTDIRDKEQFFELEDEPYSSQRVRSELFRLLRGEL